MNVFLVDAGKLFSLDASMVSKRVQDLQLALSDLADIPLDKQVLLTFDGRSLDATQHLYNYVSPVSPEKPIFLFSKSNIECHVVPPAYASLPHDKNLQARLERYMQDGQACETLKLGAELARDYHNYAEEILLRTRQLVEDQELQRKGWAAVISNLDQVTLGFDKRVDLFHDLYDSFLKFRDKYGGMLVQFEEDVKILSQIPLSNGILEHMKKTKMIDSIRCSKDHGLGITESMREPDPGGSPIDAHNSPHSPHSLDDNKTEFISLLHWIEAQDSQNSLNSLVLQCTRALDQINTSFLPRVQEEIDKVKQSLQAPGMRDIRGLEERLQQLQSLLIQTERICEEQASNANTICNQQESFMAQGDVSVLSDLLIAHKDQLKRLHSNNRTIIEFANKFSAAKGELSQNLLIRLNWVTHCQKAIWNCDGRLTMVSENLVRVKRRFAILEQINISPTLYFKCLGEASRRGNFTKGYKTKGKQILDKVEHERDIECRKRTEFHGMIQGHFLTTLFRGLDSLPTEFAAKASLSFDEDLFDISEEEMSNLTQLFPAFSHLLVHTVDETMAVCSTNMDGHSQTDEIQSESYSQPASSPESERMLRTKTEELTVQLDKSMKLEIELSCCKEQIAKLDELNKELENNLQSTQEELECKLKEITTITPQIEELSEEKAVVQQECTAFQALACEKENRISALKNINDQLKLQQQGWLMEKPKLEDLQTQIKSQASIISEKEDIIKNLQRELDLARSGETVNERHRQQLQNLQLEIEMRAERERKQQLDALRLDLDKEKMFELEKLKLEKDKYTEEMERNSKLRHRETEDGLDKLVDETSKLLVKIAILETRNTELQKENDENLETYAMFKAEAERDIKLQKQNAAVVLDELKTQAARRETSYQDRISVFQEQINSRPGPSGVADISGHMSSHVTGKDGNLSHLTAQLEQQRTEIETLRASKTRCIDVAVTQFQKGDTVLFYFDETKTNYLIANINPNEYQYFLHPDNLAALGLSLDPATRKPWAIGVIKDKEFCQARKVNNRFKVPEGRKFYRVYATPRGADPSRHPDAS